MKYLSIIISLSCLIFLMVSCNKNKSTIKYAQVYPLSADIKHFLDFHEGSYWIYTDSLNNETDSFAISSYIYDPRKPESDPLIQDESITININEYKLPSGSLKNATWQIQLMRDQAYVTYLNFGSQPVVYSIYNIRQTFPLAYANICNDSVYTQDSLYATLNVHNTAYDSVYAFYFAHRANQCYRYAQKDWLYLSADAGFVKIQQSNVVQRTLLLQKAFIVR